MLSSRKPDVTCMPEKGSVKATTSELTPPPSYTDNVAAPPLDITAAFSNLDLSTSNLPTPDLTLAHLKLLEAFYQLREDISQRDGLFGVKDEYITMASLTEKDVHSAKRFEAESIPDERNRRLAQVREKRWEVYVSRAARRFETWWERCVQRSVPMKAMACLHGTKADPRLASVINFPAEHMPPLGKQKSMLGRGILIAARCNHGLACLSAQSANVLE